MKKNTLILFSILFFFVSCKQDKSKENFLFTQLQKTNLLLKENNKEIKPLLEEMFFKRCQNTNNFSSELKDIIKALDLALSKSNELLKTQNLSEIHIVELETNYKNAITKMYKFVSRVKEWKVNSYQLIEKDYSEFNSSMTLSIILKMQNDLLLNKSALYDFILFYSVCKYKPSSFIFPTARNNKLNISSTNEFNFELSCDIPEGKDDLRKQIKDLEIKKNGKRIKLSPEINFVYSDTAKVQAVIDFEEIEKGEYLVKGNYEVSRTLKNKKDTIKTIMPFQFFFIKN